MIDRRQFMKLSAVTAGIAAVDRMTLADDGHPTDSSAEHTKGPAPAVTPFSFCVVADPHCNEKPKKGIESLGNGVDKFLACIRQMEALPESERPDFALVCGDVHLWALDKHLDKIAIPLHVISGNHETPDRKRQMRDLFPSDFKQGGREADYYAFVHKGVRFIGVCDAMGSDHIGAFCSEDIIPRGQCEWLEDQLAQPEPHKILFAHIPPEPDGLDRNMYLARNDSRYFNDLIRKVQPTAAFFGHQHRNWREYNLDRTRLVVLPSCCWNGDRSPLGFAHVRMTGSGMEMDRVVTGKYPRAEASRQTSTRDTNTPFPLSASSGENYTT